MTGERLARATLALDFIYCAVVGALLVLFNGRLASLLRAPGILVVAAGVATAAWGFVVLGQSVRIDWRRGIKQTLVANGLASTLLALAAALHPARGARALLAFTALDVMALAVAQALSLVRRRRS